MSDIYESIAKKIAGWKTIFKDNIESVTGKSDPRDAAGMSYVEIMQITQGADYTIENITEPTATALVKIGVFTKEENEIIRTNSYVYSRDAILPCIEADYSLTRFDQQAATNPLISTAPQLNGHLVGIVFHNFGNIKMLEIFYETTDEAVTQLPDTLIVSSPYLATIKAVENLEDILQLKEQTQAYKAFCSQEVPF